MGILLINKSGNNENTNKRVSLKKNNENRQIENNVEEEIVSLRRENSKMVRSNDIMRKVISAVPQYYREKSTGELMPIDTELIDNGTKYVCEKNSFKVGFEKDSCDGKLYEISKDDYNVSLYYNNKKQGLRSHTDGCACKQCSEKNKVNFVMQDGTEIVYETINNGIKENIIISEKQNSYEYNFVMSIKGLKAEEGDNNSLLLKDIQTGKSIFKIPAPFMCDANGVRSNDVSYEIDVLNDELNFKVKASSEFINANDRVFPITIDPDIIEIIDDMWSFSSLEIDEFGFEMYVDGALEVGSYSSGVAKCNIVINESKIKEKITNHNYIKKYLRLYKKSSSKVGGYFVAQGKKYSGSLDVYDIEFTDWQIEIETYAGDPLQGMIEFCVNGDNAPLLVVEYPIDENIGGDSDNSDSGSVKQIPFKEISLGNSVTGYLNLKNASMISAVNDITVGKSLPIQIKHIHRASDKNKGCYGYNWRLNLNRTLKESEYSNASKTVFNYVNELGETVELVEKYYYIKEGFKVAIDKKDVVTDISGNLTYNGYEVRSYQISDDVTLISEIKDFVGADLIDSRQSEQIQLEENITAYEERLQDLIIVNTSTESIKYNIENISIEEFEKKWEELKSEGYSLMTESNWKLWKNTQDSEDWEILTKQIKRNVAIYENYFVSYRRKKAELEQYIAQSPINYIKDNNGIISGFNAAGNLVCIFDRYENIMYITYNTDGNISEIYEGNEKVADFIYERGLLISITDSRGRTVEFNYNKKDNNKNELSSITYPDQSEVTLEYSSDCLSNIKYSNGLQYKPSYKSGVMKNLLVKGTTPSTGTIADISISLGDNSLSIFNETTNESEEFTLNDNNDIVRHVEKDEYDVSTYTNYKYEKAGTKLTITTGSNINKIHNMSEEIIEEYDDMKFLKSKTEVKRQISNSLFVESVTNYSYDSNDKLISEIKSTVYTDNDDNEVKTVVSVNRYHYNAQGNLVLTESYIEGEELTTGINYVEHVFDSKGREIKTISWNSLDSSSKFYSEINYSENGEKVSECNEEGAISSEYEYVNGSNVINSITYSNGSKLAYGRDPNNDDVTSITQSTESGESNTTDIVYKNGLPIEIKSGNTELTYSYDYAQRKSVININGQQQYAAIYNQKYSYNAEEELVSYGTVTENLYSDNSAKFAFVTSKYGSVDNETGATRLTEDITLNKVAVSKKEYDGYRRLTDETNGNHKVSYSYDEYDRVIKASVTYNSVSQIVQIYAYDKYSSLTNKIITGAVSHSYSYAYKSNAAHELYYIMFDTYKFMPLTDVNGRNTGKEIYSGSDKLAAEYITYRKVGDHATNMPATVWFGSGSDIKESIRYKYDSRGNICEIRENGDLKVKYSYDALGRLCREDNLYFKTTFIYSYDTNGNITSRCEYPYTARSNDDLNELECVHYEYEYDGDRLKSYNGEEFKYNNLGCPTLYRGKTVTWNNGKQLKNYKGTSFTYNGIGSRATKGSISFTYDADGNLIKQSNGFEFFYDNSGVAGFIYNFKYFYRKDAQGNIIAILDSDGNVVVQYKYDAWGNHAVLDKNGNDITDSSNIGNLNPFRYRSYYYDTETGLYYLQTRYYDPEVGRFVSQDSIEYADPETINGINLYAYCGNNPVMNVDPTGEFFFLFLLIGLIAGAAVGGISAAVKGESIWDGIWKGAVVGGLFGLSLSVIGLGVGLMATSSMAASIAIGAGIGSAFALSANLSSQLQNGGIGSLDMKSIGMSWGIGLGVGAFAGAMSYAGNVIGQTIGHQIGLALSGKTFLGVLISRVISTATLAGAGSALGGALGGYFAGKFINDLIIDSGLQNQGVPLWVASIIKKLFSI